ncbi:hypothetical protein TNCT_3301 [Trichonephila clavata]|uniref:Uncharacterized protein n=1 Tax=Trichonephila clavata TaxID=2740835 RepID=A0A8X6LED6_TRICU|nr:hypothetical protein TNCT_3301 [Trichonephila clavata]
MSVCDGLRAARRRFKSQVENLWFGDICLQGLIRSSDEEFMTALEGANTLRNICIKMGEYLRYAKSLLARIELARSILLGKVNHPEFLPPAEEELKRLTSRLLIAEIDMSFMIPYVVNRYNSEVRR